MEPWQLRRWQVEQWAPIVAQVGLGVLGTMVAYIHRQHRTELTTLQERVRQLEHSVIRLQSRVSQWCD